VAAVTFDVWHTLVHLEPVESETYYRAQVATAVEALRDAPRAAGAPAGDDSYVAREFERVLTAAVDEANRGRTIPPAEQILRVGAAVGRRPDADRYVQRLDALVARQPFRSAPGAATLLDALRRDGYRLAAVGNTVGETGRAMRGVLERLGLKAPFEAFVFSDEHPWAKPSPEPFWAAVTALGEEAARAIHVGDAWFDIAGARRAGFRAAIRYTGLARYGEQYRSLLERGDDPDAATEFEVERLDEVRPIVHRLLAPADGRGRTSAP